MADDPGTCFLCDKLIASDADVRQIKGDTLQKFISASKERQDGRHLKINRLDSIDVHANCAKNYTNQGKIEMHISDKGKKKNREPNLYVPPARQIRYCLIFMNFVFFTEKMRQTILSRNKKEGPSIGE